jgi:hypothetical protein
MKDESVPPLIWGVALTLLTGLSLWQLVVVTLMVRAMVDVLTALVRLI